MSTKGPPLRVFVDTNALLAMVLFPSDDAGQPTLAGEVKALYESDAFEMVVSKVVVHELMAVVDDRFPDQRVLSERLVRPFDSRLTPWPNRHDVRSALPFVLYREDAPVFAAAAVSKPDIVLSNDFETVYAQRAKPFWTHHGIRVESLYGLLCVFGRRERKEGEAR